MSYKMLVLDLDGTLTNSEKEITPKTKAALRGLQERNIPIVLASGRPTPGVLPVAKELEMEKYGGYLLSYNGGRIMDCKTGTVLYEKTLPPEKIPQISRFAKENGVTVLSYEGDCLITEDPEDQYVQLEAAINGIPVKKVENFSQYVQFPVVKCLVVGDGDKLTVLEERAKKEIGEKLNIYRSEPYFLETMPEQIDKAFCLGKLLELTGIRREEIVACGDGFNDLSMIRFAGLGVAMENAQAVVKEAADHITLSNDEDGIAAVIEKFFLREECL